MKKKDLGKSRKLNFDERFESSEPGISHRFGFEFAKNYLENKNILDIGCWTGAFEYFLNDFPCQATAVEIEEKAIAIASKRYSNIKFINASVFELPFKDNSFQVVTMWLVLEHLPNNSEKQAFIKINKVLNTGGYFILSTPYYHWLNNLLDLAYHFVNHRHYKKDALFKMLNDSGFEIEKFTIRGGLFSLFSGWFFLFFKYFIHRPPPKVKWFDKLIEREFNKNGIADFFIVAKKV